MQSIAEVAMGMVVYFKRELGIIGRNIIQTTFAIDEGKEGCQIVRRPTAQHGNVVTNMLDDDVVVMLIVMMRRFP